MSVKAKKGDWVVPHGKAGELGHCTRCGRGLTFGGVSQPIPIVVAAMKAFVKMHKECREGQHAEPRPVTPLEWAAGRDTGISSLTIYHVMTGNPSPHGHFSVPWDPDDFGRCYRLLKLFPHWQKDLPKVAEKFPEWKGLIAAWPELANLYEEELPNETAPKLYARMKKLIKK